MTEAYVIAHAPFEAARRVEILPEGHRSRGLHGHSFVAKALAEVNDDWADYPGIEAELFQRRLALCVESLDYTLLNNLVSVPTDENLARWIRARMVEVTGLTAVGIQSTADSGVNLDADGSANIWHRIRFEAAHQLPNVPEGHQCGRMHGHGFEVELHVRQALGDTDMGVDFDQIKAVADTVRSELHLSCLNDIDGLENPTSELLAAWVWNRVALDLSDISYIAVRETATAGCVFDGQNYRIWKEARFESAVQLRSAPKGDEHRTLHGHSYLLRMHLQSDLDEVMGWTVDFGDVKRVFSPVGDILDHRQLDVLENFDNADSISVLEWIGEQLRAELPQVSRLELFETPSRGVLLSFSDEAPLGVL